MAVMSVLAKHSATIPLQAAVMTLAGVVVALIRHHARMPSRVAFARGVPLFGLFPRIVSGLFNLSLYDDVHELHKEHGQTFAFHCLGNPVVATIDPQNLEHVLKRNFDNYVKGDLLAVPFTDLLGSGIFNVDGQQWYHQRKLASRMFTKRQFETHIWDVMQDKLGAICAVLEQSAGQPVCMFNMLNRFTLDTIGEIGFSSRINSLEDPSSPFLKSFDVVQSAMAKRFWTGQGMPLWQLFRSLGLFWERDFPKHLAVINEHTYAVVDDLMQKVDKGEDNSFVGLFMRDPANQEMRRTDERGFRTFMRDMVLNFLIAGRDTTAQCLTWTLFELAQHPAALHKVRAEVAAVCGDGRLDYQHLKDLKYVRAVVDEGLRLHPSVPCDSKVAVEADTLPDGTRVPAGCMLQFCPYAQGRCEALWGGDAGAFRPERWLERRRPSTFEYVNFNAGPRECLGRRLAEVEMAALLAVLVRSFDFELAVRPEAVRYDMQLTLGCSTGLPMLVRPRMPRLLDSAGLEKSTH